MIEITLNQENFRSDIYALTRSFFQAEEILVNTPSENHSEYYELKITHNFNQAANIALPKRRDYGERTAKNEMKRALYNALSDYTKKILPWGALSGVRPVRLARVQLEAGLDNMEAADYMMREFYVSPQKAALSVEIAQKEIALLSSCHCQDGYSLYVGIPFCPSRCLYCSFASYPIESYRSIVGKYLETLQKELKFISSAFSNRVPDTIYIGGGTPSALSDDELKLLLNIIAENFDITELMEFTLEAGRADSIDRVKLDIMRSFGVSRISVNPQSMNQKTLDLIGRCHSVEDVKRAFYLARSTGFDNINMDMILGLPEESDSDVAHSVEEICRMMPDSLTVHSLALKRASRLKEESFPLRNIHNSDETMEIASNGARRLGMKPYYLYRQKNISGNLENTGFSLEGKEGLYNVLMMEEAQTIAAAGAGTVSKYVGSDGQIARCDSAKDLSLYIENIDEMIERKRRLFCR